jgi:hypothetical protein
LKHLGPGFGKHSTKTRPEVQAELTTPKKKSSTKDYTQKAEKNSF